MGPEPGLVAVTGAGGTVGRHVVAELAAAGVAARALTRSSRPVEGAAESRAFSFTDPETWTRAFEGAEGLFLMRPPAIGNVRRDLLPAVAAARAAGVGRVAFLSVLGAERNPLLPHHAVERWLADSGVAASSIRAGNFMQNLLSVHAPDIRRGELVLPAGRAALSYVDARDVAAVAARAVVDDRAAGRAWSPTGPAAITHGEVAAILGEVLGWPVRYRSPGLPGWWRHARRELDLPPTMVAVTTVLYGSARFGIGARVTGDVPTVLGRRARDLRTFVRDHRDAFRGPERDTRADHG